jgi:peptidoglycan biosynthesis protein MviN/MurJ (putative lipid II flippase)
MDAALACIILDGKDLFCLEHFAPVILNLEFLFQAIFLPEGRQRLFPERAWGGKPP